MHREAELAQAAGLALAGPQWNRETLETFVKEEGVADLWLRKTGRTTATLLRALWRAEEGDEVVIACPSQQLRDAVSRRLGELVRAGAAVSNWESIRVVGSYRELEDWAHERLRRVEPGQERLRLLFDHDWEFAPLSARRAALRLERRLQIAQVLAP